MVPPRGPSICHVSKTHRDQPDSVEMHDPDPRLIVRLAFSYG